MSGIWLNTAKPMVAILCTIVVAVVIFISRKIERGVPLIVLMVAIVSLLIRHSVYLEHLNSSQTDLISGAYGCLGIDLLLLLVTFISFLWIDDIVAKNRNLKSYDNSLSWFWDKL